jgi:hypothetical protein
MKERPILFSGPMVRALLAGKKTQTRRVLKLSPDKSALNGWRHAERVDWHEKYGWCAYSADVSRVSEWFRCPYGAVGDRLYVKEGISLLVKHPDGDTATYDADDTLTLLDTWPWQRPKLPGMFLPRGLSRITLEITGLRVERLHDISEDDAAAEGVERDTMPCDHTRQSCKDVGYMGPTHRSTFAELWMAINGVDSWKANPWVWVVEFKRIEAII